MEMAPFFKPMTRRIFVVGSTFGLTSMVVAPEIVRGMSVQSLTVQQVIDIILKEIPGAPFQKTVDTLKSGKADTPVTGIVSTMFATVQVIKKAIDLKANFIITHEPTFYNHQDDTAWLEQDGVYKYKRELLDKHNITVWRFHDYWHTHQPDGVQMGVIDDLGWKQYYDLNNPRIITLPATSLKNIISHVKEKLGIKHVRTIGDPSQLCERVLLMPGASGGRSQIQQLMKEQPDVLICGEVAEWETSEYIRDAVSMGLKRALIVLGHAQSEEPGMKWLVQWLQPKIPGVRIIHIPSYNPFNWV